MAQHKAFFAKAIGQEPEVPIPRVPGAKNVLLGTRKVFGDRMNNHGETIISSELLKFESFASGQAKMPFWLSAATFRTADGDSGVLELSDASSLRGTSVRTCIPCQNCRNPRLQH
jgi:hypothetical protein